MAGTITSLGVGSSLDLQNILDQLRKSEETVITRAQTEKTNLEKRRNEFNTVNAKYLSMKSSALTLSLSSTYLTRKNNISNTSVLNAVTYDGADMGNHSVQVNRMASNSSFLSSGKASKTLSVAVPTYQKSVEGFDNTNSDIVLADGEDMTIAYGYGDDRKVITVTGTTGGMTMDDLVAAINSHTDNDAGGGDHYVTATTEVGDDNKHYLKIASFDGGTGEDQRVMITQLPDSTGFIGEKKSFSYSVGDKDPVTIEVSADTSLESLVTLINNTPNNGGVTASIIDTGSGSEPYKLVLKSNETGEASRITMHSQLDDLSLEEQHGSGKIMEADQAISSFPVIILAASNNNEIIFQEDDGSGYGSNLTAAIPDGVYNNGEDLAAAVEGALETASTAQKDYTVTFNTTTQKLEITEEGELTGLSILWGDSGSTAGAVLGFSTDSTITPKESSLNSAFSVDGINYQRMGNGNITGIIDGVKLTFSETGSSNISISSDTEQISSEIKKIVATLNELISHIDANDDFDETTEEWGPLAQTTSIQTAQSQIMDLLTANPNISGEVASFQDLGLEVNRDGSLTLDEGILNEKISTSLEDVQNFLLGNDDITGMADQLNDLLTDFTKSQGIIKTETEAVDLQIQQINDDIKKKTEYMDKKYETMAMEFTELDRYMRRMQSQQNFITQMIDTNNNSDN